ncbi:MAG: AAA family ATPase [Solirubrobacterales bacterium]
MLLGRASELERVGDLAGNARKGSGGALLIVGEPGIGKTSLLSAATARIDGLRAIRVAGIEAEASLPYAALGEAVAPLLGELERLPGPQAEAIEAALALIPAPAGPGDRLATCAAFLSLLTGAAESEPLLLMVDDAHWLDPPSAECFAFAARRLAGSRVVLIAAARPGADGPLLGSRWLNRLELPALGNDDARRMLRGNFPDMTSAVVESLIEISAGNPLALRELPAELSEDQRLGLAPIDHFPVAAEALLEAFEARLRALDPSSRAALVVASAAADWDLGPVVAACNDLGIEAAAMERAEAAGALSIGEGRIRFSHPLVKTVAYDRSAPDERRRAHRALADHCGADARAWHLAAATVGPDDEVADLLEAAADRAGARGAPSVAADAMQRSAAFTEGMVGRSRRLYKAALSAALAGTYDRCAALLESTTEIEDPMLRARSRHGLVLVKMTGGMGLSPDAPIRLGEEAELIVAAHPAVAASMHADAALLAGTSGRFELGAAASRRAEAVLPDDASSTVKCQVRVMSGISAALGGDGKAARRPLDEAGELLTEIDSLSPAIQSIVLGLHARVCSGQEQILRAELARLIAMARDTDTFGLLPYLLCVSADAAYRTGDWDASAHDAEAVSLAEEYGQGGILPYALVVSGRLHAARGETGEARLEFERGAALAEEGGAATVANLARAGAGFLELGLGRAEEAIVMLEQVEAFAERAGLVDPVFIPWAPDLVEAYVRAGRRQDAERVSASLDRRAGRADVPGTLALSARARGLVSEDGFEGLFEEAIGHHERGDAPFETARTLFAYGSRLHRARRRVEGRERLRAALEIFNELRAKPWIEQTNDELRSAGAIRRNPVADPDELSPQEVRVARAVAGGATNKEVAARLYLSPKTIEFHLGRVYRKLGIHSRTELATNVARGDLENGKEAKGP